jgi:cobaltochelatase CobT
MPRQRVPRVTSSDAKRPRPASRVTGAQENRLDPLREAVLVCTRALAERRELEVIFSADDQPSMVTFVRLPPLPARLTRRDCAILRGYADSAALRLAHHDRTVHDRLSPKEPKAQAMFEAAEQARVEAVGSRRMTGTAQNLAARLEDHYLQPRFAAIGDREAAPIEDALAMLLRERLTGVVLPARKLKIVELWRPLIERAAGPLILELDAAVEDQAAYGRVILRIISALKIYQIASTILSPQETQQMVEAESEKEPGPIEGPDRSLGSAEALKSAAQDAIGTEPTYGESEAAEKPGHHVFAQSRDATQRENSQPSRTANLHPSRHIGDYRIYTTRYDEIVWADELATHEELRYLRREVDVELAPLRRFVGRLANRMQRRLLALAQCSWEFDRESGVLDTARLTRVVTDPTSALVYKEEKRWSFRDTVVTLLLDNSGSMRGRPSMVVAVCADILARALERCGVKVEILGFTTRSWRGGQSRQAWLEAGKPDNPGRLNDIRHIIYKSADMPWHRASTNLGLLMQKGLHKENIDGEALVWAHRRLMARPEQRRILIVLADGAPVDESTLSASISPGNCLENHLRVVIKDIAELGLIELLAIGIGYDVGRFYARAVKVEEVDELGTVLIEQLSMLLGVDVQHHSKIRRRPSYPNNPWRTGISHAT